MARKKYLDVSQSSSVMQQDSGRGGESARNRKQNAKALCQGAGSSTGEGLQSRRKEHHFPDNSVSSRTRAKTKDLHLVDDGALRGGKKRQWQVEKKVGKKSSARRAPLPHNPYPTPSGSSDTEPSVYRCRSTMQCQRTETPCIQRYRNSDGDHCRACTGNGHCSSGSDFIHNLGEEQSDGREEEEDCRREDNEGSKEGDSDEMGEVGKCGDVECVELSLEGSGDVDSVRAHHHRGSCGCIASGCPLTGSVDMHSTKSSAHSRAGSKRHMSGADQASPPKKCHSATTISQGKSWAPDSGPSMASSSSSPSSSDRFRKTSYEYLSNRQQWLDTFKLWSNAERVMALDDLIAHCELPQVRHMMQKLEPHFQRDFISLLPKELALYVLSFLKPKDLLKAAQTCQYWHVLCEDNLLWREKCMEEGIDEKLVFGSRAQRKSNIHRHYKALYLRQSSIEHKWRIGASQTPLILRAHDDHVITCLEFCGQRIVSGSDDNTLKVWSAVTGKCLQTLVGHTGGVWSSQMSGNIVISGSTDRTLKIWNAETGICKHTLFGHTSTVRCMSLYDRKVVSGSRDATMRVWDIDMGHCLHVLTGHMAAVRCVQYNGKYVVSGAYDYSVRVWSPETESCLHVLQGHTNRVYSLQFDGIHIVSGSLDTSIRVWRVEGGQCLHTLVGHQSLTSGLELKDNLLVSGNADSTVKVWDVTTGQCLQTLQGPNKHQSAVTCLQFNKKFVVTSSDDGTVKIWDLHTGEFLRNLVTLPSGGSGGVVWRLRCSNTKLVCAVGSRNGTEETKLMVLDFDVEERKAPS